MVTSIYNLCNRHTPIYINNWFFLFNRCCKAHDDCYGDIQWTIGDFCNVYSTSFSYNMNLQTERVGCCKCSLKCFRFHENEHFIVFESV